MKREKLKFKIWRLSVVRIVVSRSVFWGESNQSPLECGAIEGESPVWFDDAPVWYVSKESRSLRLLRKLGGKYLLKLNTGERPIANKYREGKLKRTLKRELNSTWNCQKGNAWNQYWAPQISLWVHFAASGSASVWLRVESVRKVASGVIAARPCSGPNRGTQSCFGDFVARKRVSANNLLIVGISLSAR